MRWALKALHFTTNLMPLKLLTGAVRVKNSSILQILVNRCGFILLDVFLRLVLPVFDSAKSR